MDFVVVHCQHMCVTHGVYYSHEQQMTNVASVRGRERMGAGSPRPHRSSGSGVIVPILANGW